jgi:hypothetical protein
MKIGCLPIEDSKGMSASKNVCGKIKMIDLNKLVNKIFFCNYYKEFQRSKEFKNIFPFKRNALKKMSIQQNVEKK